MQKAFTIYHSQVFEYESEAVGDTFTINVRLPETYTPEGDGYPVLLALDADAAFPMLSDVLTLLEWEQRIPPMILVAPGYGVPLNHEKNRRMRDYMPVEGDIPIDDAGNTRREGGGAPQFLQFIREELLPHINATYHTDPDTCAFAGVSAGGAFGTYTMLHQPETFTHYLISSPALSWWNQRMCFDYLEAFAGDDLPLRVFFSVGQEETDERDYNFVGELREFVDKLRARKFPGLQMKHVALYGGHLSSQPEAVTRGLCYLFENWQQPDESSG